MLTNFENSSTVRLYKKSAARSLLYFSPDLKHITTLPCKNFATDTFHFQQVTDGVCGMSKLVTMEMIFIIPEMKILFILFMKILF